MTDIHGIARMVHSLEVGQGWVDPGLSIVGTLDPRLDGPHVQVEGGKLDMARPTRPQQPAIITYSITDIAGNEATPVGRLVHITCPEGEHICPEEAWTDGLACSSMKLCNAPADLVEMNIPWSLSASDPEPLQITLVGNSTVELTVGTPYDRCEQGSAPWHICDRGVTAINAARRGVVVEACPGERGSLIGSYDFHSAGLAGCLVDTQTVGTYTVTFVATDLSDSRRVATSTRIVKVLPDCGPFELVCSDGSCSVDHICIGQDGSLIDLPHTESELQASTNPSGAPGDPPSLQLATGMGSTIQVKQNSPFSECRPGQPFDEDEPCMPAPRAVDSGGRDISSWVFVPPGDVDPMHCLSDGCTGTEYAVAGIAPAGINTSAPVGTVFSLKFVAIDGSGQLSWTEQWVTISPPCDRDEFWCDGQCMSVPCEVALRFGWLAQADAAQVDLDLLGPDAITIGYGSPLPGSVASLLPCSTSAEVLAHSCGAAARAAAAQPTDLLQGLMITELATCPEGVDSCPRCSATFLGQGPLHCLPGTYTYEYWLLSSSANVSRTRTVVIEDNAGTLQMQLSLPLDIQLSGLSAVDEAITALLDGKSPQALAVRQQVLAVVNEVSINIEPGEDVVSLPAVQIHMVSLLSSSALGVTVRVALPHWASELVQDVLNQKMLSIEPIVRDVFAAATRRAGSPSSIGQLVALSYSPPVAVDKDGGAMASLVSSILQAADQMAQFAQKMERFSALTLSSGVIPQEADVIAGELAFLRESEAMFSRRKVGQGTPHCPLRSRPMP